MFLRPAYILFSDVRLTLTGKYPICLLKICQIYFHIWMRPETDLRILKSMCFFPAYMFVGHIYDPICATWEGNNNQNWVTWTTMYSICGQWEQLSLHISCNPLHV